jgi:hypothetical protein
VQLKGRVRGGSLQRETRRESNLNSNLREILRRAMSACLGFSSKLLSVGITADGTRKKHVSPAPSHVLPSRCAEGSRSRILPPVPRQSGHRQFRETDILRNDELDRDQIGWNEVDIAMDETFEASEGQRFRCVNNRPTGRVPAGGSEKPIAPVERISRERLPANAKSPH